MLNKESVIVEKKNSGKECERKLNLDKKENYTSENQDQQKNAPKRILKKENYVVKNRSKKKTKIKKKEDADS